MFKYKLSDRMDAWTEADRTKENCYCFDLNYHTHTVFHFDKKSDRWSYQRIHAERDFF